MARTNLLKLGTTKDTPIETMRFMLDLPPVQTRQKGKQVKTYFNAVESSHNSITTPRSRKRHKGVQTGTGQVLDGSSRGLNTANMPAVRELKQTKEWERGTDSGVSRLSCRKTWKALSRLFSRQNGVRD